MDVVADIQNQINNLKNSYNNAVANNRQLDKKIAKLEEAKDYVQKAINKAGDLKGSLKKTEPADGWTGSNADSYEDQVSTSEGHAGTLKDRLGDLKWAIDGELVKLRLSKNYFVEIIDGFSSSMNKLNNQLQQAIDQQNADNNSGGGAW